MTDGPQFEYPIPVASSAQPYQDAAQLPYALADIAAAGVPAPVGFWNLDADLIDLVVGGAGYDMAPGFDEEPGWEMVQGVPLAADAMMAAYFNGAASLESPGPSNPGSIYNLDADVSIQAWAKMDYYTAQGDENDPYRVVCYVNRSSTTLGTSTSPPYFLGFAPREGTSGNSAAIHCGYYDTTGTVLHEIVWEISGLPAKVPLGAWVHLCMTRQKISAGDNTLTLYANGVQIAQATGLPDANLPTSINQRLQIGEGRGTIAWFGGLVRAVGIWNTPLSAANVLALYELGFAA